MLLAAGFAGYWFNRASAGGGRPAAPGAVNTAIGFVTNFFDTLGIGSFATTTTIYRLFRRVEDQHIPGTLNVGHAIPTVAQAWIYTTLVQVDFATLALLIVAAVGGSWIGAAIVSRLPKAAIQRGMGVALLLAAVLMVMTALNRMPGGGEAIALRGGALILACGINFVLGALMTLGIGLYAPCMIMVSLMGMNPTVAFPIMMGSCAFLMPVAGLQFINDRTLQSARGARPDPGRRAGRAPRGASWSGPWTSPPSAGSSWSWWSTRPSCSSARPWRPHRRPRRRPADHVLVIPGDRTMRYTLSLTMLATLAAPLLLLHGGTAVAGQAPAAAPAAPPLTLTTTAFPDGGVIPDKYTQAGEQVSPALTWTNVPAGTVSFVLNMRDPDVARNKTSEDQVHWLVWGIPGTAKGMSEGQPKGPTLPDGSQQISATGQVYRGPGAAAAGPRHHYTFELFALDTKIDVKATADPWETRTAVYAAMQGHVLGKAVYVGLFRRPQ